MNQTDNDFFEAYKHLDKLCGEIFDCGNGISEYINQMENSPQGSQLVSNWDSDYKNLKHIRWVRNQIAHESARYAISSRADIEFAESFYTRIVNLDDPFARLRRIEQKRTRRSASGKEDTVYAILDSGSYVSADSKPHNFVRSDSKHPARKKRKRHPVLTALFGILLFLLLLYYFVRQHI